MRRFLQFRLSTLIALSVAAGIAMYVMSVPRGQFSDYPELQELSDRGIPVPWYHGMPTNEWVDFVDGHAERYCTLHWKILGREFRFVYDNATHRNNGILAFDITFWLVILLIAGIGIEWVTRKFERKNEMK